MGDEVDGYCHERAPHGAGTALHLNWINILVVLLQYSPVRCNYWRKVGNGHRVSPNYFLKLHVNL